MIGFSPRLVPRFLEPIIFYHVYIIWSPGSRNLAVNLHRLIAAKFLEPNILFLLSVLLCPPRDWGSAVRPGGFASSTAANAKPWKNLCPLKGAYHPQMSLRSADGCDPAHALLPPSCPPRGKEQTKKDPDTFPHPTFTGIDVGCGKMS